MYNKTPSRKHLMKALIRNADKQASSKTPWNETQLDPKIKLGKTRPGAKHNHQQSFISKMWLRTKNEQGTEVSVTPAMYRDMHLGATKRGKEIRKALKNGS